ncbi:recombinase family protein [Paenilisteria weihenstephanensis]|uniref:recombinase family protein n=1 Tax=Listeria weihenstephanensis TaxID=1006155 RepID=UPI0004BC865C|nr:recombinase family protein [Listeria weihenstephanensis]
MNEKKIEFIKADRKLIDRSKSEEHKLQRTAAYCRVSTNSEDQLNSYRSQVTYYTDLINQNLEWVMAGVYADEAMTGTQASKRESFQKLINDCMNGDIDVVITKSISRFARNTLDTLRYVRMLKEKGVAVYFEDEKINTLTMDGELLLVVLSSVAQQEVENISSNVKKGLKMKMKRGELVGFQGCLGYDYNNKDKTLSINEEEAEIVRYIFNRYIQGVGTHIIATELTSMGYKTKRGNSKWPDSTVLGILKNEKYKGDVLLGKTFTLDPISKRRMRNFGEEDKYYIHDHHEPIVSDDVFEKVQEILLKRGSSRDTVEKNGRRKKYTREYAFSSLLECGFCGGNASRRSWHAGKDHRQIVWQCSVATKKRQKTLPT